MKLLKLAVAVLLAVLLTACGGYNSVGVKIDKMPVDSPIAQLAENGSVEMQIDPVFGVGLVENRFLKEGRYQVGVVRMPSKFLRDFRKHFYAGHHGAAVNTRTGDHYSVQWMMIGLKGFDIIDTDSGRNVSSIPCDVYMEVYIEGLVSYDPNVKFVVGDIKGEEFFDGNGKRVNFSPAKYREGDWSFVSQQGTNLKDVRMYPQKELLRVKDRTFLMSRAGRYEITDTVTQKVTAVLSPILYQQGGLKVMKDLVRKNPRYSLGDKFLAIAENVSIPISISPMDYAFWGVSLALQAGQMPLMDEEVANTVEDNDALLDRMRELNLGQCLGTRHVKKMKK